MIKKNSTFFKSYLPATILSIVTLFLIVALSTFNKNDPSIFVDISPKQDVVNYAGYCGANLAAIVFQSLGVASWFLVLLASLIILYLLNVIDIKLARRYFCATILCILWTALVVQHMSITLSSSYVGYYCELLLLQCINRLLIDSILVGTLMIIMLLFVGFSWTYPLASMAKRFLSLVTISPEVLTSLREKSTNKFYKKPIRSKTHSTIVPIPNAYSINIAEVFTAPKDELLSDDSWKKRSKLLEQKLEGFGIQGFVRDIVVGPVVTLFSYEPSLTTKISKIISLENDLALALKAHSLRIIAPIPGKSVVGFEVANAVRMTVSCTALLSSDDYKNTKATLPLILGKDVVGNNVIIDLATLPHLLLAGSTGSGKSVALHSMVASLLCHASPDDLKLVIIDPKQLEFVAYADVPHLLVPLVLESQQAVSVLRWLVSIMEERYNAMAQKNVKSVKEFHKKHGEMPYIVVIIDELADIIMTASKELEVHITRLAQKARAAGIHLIVATQRPSVDVITGTIKINFPARIALKVMSKMDSRIILDSNGAEKLLGKGDMLFLDHQGVIRRVHGAYLEDADILSLVNYLQQFRNISSQYPVNEHEISIIS